jgi:hypothetical protein
MLHLIQAKDGVPSIGGMPDLAFGKTEQWLRGVTVKGRHVRSNWNDGRQNLRRPIDGLLATRPVRVMSESRYPTSS